MEELKSPRLLVVGGTGFIGHHLLKAACEKSWQVTSVSLNYPSEERLIQEVCYLQLDLTNRELLREKLSGLDFNYVVNLGGYIDHTLFKDGGRKLIDVHFTGLQNLVAVLKRDSLKRFVQIGSSDEYGNALAPQSEDLREQPMSPYSIAKVAGTHFLQMLYRSERFPAVILRLFLTYGPGRTFKRFLPQIINGCLRGESFATSAGEQIRDFCYVSDTVEAILQALQKPEAKGGVFNVASGQAVSIRSMTERICSQIGNGQPQFGQIPYRPGENMQLYADISKVQETLFWQPRISLVEGLRKTIEWYETKI